MRALAWLAAAMVVASFVACAGRAPPQIVPASAISVRGFAAHGFDVPPGVGRALTLRGYVDHANLYGDAGAKAILGQWWSGDGPDTSIWRFNLKAQAEDGAGQSFPVHVASDAGRDALLRAMAADARAGRPTPVVVRGTVTTFVAPMDMTTRRGLLMTVGSSRDVRLGDAAAEAQRP